MSDIGHDIVQMLIERQPSLDELRFIKQVVNDYFRVMEWQLRVIESFEQYCLDKKDN